MASTGKTIATLLLGAAVGAAVGYILATDKESRQDGISHLKDRIASLKSKFTKDAQGQDLEEEIYNA